MPDQNWHIKKGSSPITQGSHGSVRTVIPAPLVDPDEVPTRRQKARVTQSDALERLRDWNKALSVPEQRRD